MLKISRDYNFLHYLFIFLILQFTCVPFWASYKITMAILVVIAFYFYFMLNKTIEIDNKILLIFAIYTLIAIIQGLLWAFSLVSLLSSFSFTFLLGYLVFKIYKFDFLILFERVFKVLTIISMIIWAAQNWVPEAARIINTIISALHNYSSDEWARSMFIYTYWDGLSVDSYLFSRNAGFLHEPGAFALMAILATVINYVKGKALLDKGNFIYFAAIISTVSTAGYISLTILVLLLVRQKKQRILSLLILPVLLSASVYSYNNFDFMKDKIEGQYADQTTKDLNQGSSGRIFGARKSLNVLLKYPLFGRGLNTISQASYDSPDFAGYGWISYVSKFGLVFATLFMFFFIRGIYRIVKIGGYGLFEFIIIALAIIINLSSQAYIAKPFFFIFFYAGLYKITIENMKRTGYNYLKNVPNGKHQNGAVKTSSSF